MTKLELSKLTANLLAGVRQTIDSVLQYAFLQKEDTKELHELRHKIEVTRNELEVLIMELMQS